MDIARKTRGKMEPFLLLHISLSILTFGVHGELMNRFLDTHKDAVQDYIMTGKENGWQSCDIITDIPHSYKDVPQMAMTLTNLKTLSKKSAFASMDCLLAIYDIEDKISLSALLEFGWEAVQHVRLALVLRMSSGMTLALAPNTTKIPFLIAAQLEDGTAQFLCPVVGESEPRLEHGMCSPSNVAYKGKTLRLGLMGILPYFLLQEDGSFGGTNVMIIKMLAERLGFKPDIVPALSYNAAEDLVSLQCR